MASIYMSPIDSSNPIWVKYTISYADLAAADTVNDIELFQIPAKGVIHAAVMFQPTSFSGGGCGFYVVSLGIAGQLERILSEVDVFAESDPTLYGSVVVNYNKLIVSMTTPTSIRVSAISDVDLNLLTAGSVDIWVQQSVLP